MTGEGVSTKDLVLLLHDKVDRALIDHEQRLRRLEQWKWWLTVSTSGAGVMGGAAAALLLTFTT